MIERMGRSPELALVLEEDSMGWALSPDEPEKLLEPLLEAYSEREDLHGTALRARTIALEKYSERALRNRKVLSS
jgi:hypothetical protein